MTIPISQPHPLIKLQYTDSSSPLHPSASLRHRYSFSARGQDSMKRGGGDAVFRSDDGVRLKNLYEIYLVATCG